MTKSGEHRRSRHEPVLKTSSHFALRQTNSQPNSRYAVTTVPTTDSPTHHGKFYNRMDRRMVIAKIRSVILALHIVSCKSSHASAMLRQSYLASGAFIAIPSCIVRGNDNRSQRHRVQLLSESEINTETITETEAVVFQIREAQYSDLAAAANLMTDGFYPELRNNPIMRPIRYLMELDRLQSNFPYEPDDRHYYLVAYVNNDDEGTGIITSKVVGFCDIDGRIPKGGADKGLSLLPFVKYVQRPQPYFSDLAIDPEYRRRGIASALMIEAEQRAKNMGFEELYLGVRSTNELALQMYSKIGYESIIPQGDMLAFLEIQKDVRMLRRSLDVLRE